MADVTFEIKEYVAVLSERNGGWTKEFNLVSWNGGEPKADIREWKDDHSSMKKGITLSRQEFLVLKNAVTAIDAEKISARTAGKSYSEESGTSEKARKTG